MKKLIAAALALMLALSLCACGSSGSMAPDTAPENTPAGNAQPSTPDSSGTDSPAVEWPKGKLTLYCPGNVGDPIDSMVRVWADAYAEATGGDVEVVSDGTGDGEILFQLLKNADPDGMTLLIGGAGQVMQYYAGVHQDNPVDPSCFTVVAPSIWQAKMAAGCLTQPDAPYDSIEELAAYAKEHPGEITCAMSSGTSRYLAMTRLLQAMDIYGDVRLVEASSSEITAGLLGGTINIALMNDQYIPQYLQDGSLKCLILTRIDREYSTYLDEDASALLDTIPIFSDYDLNDYYTVSPMCVFGPAGMSGELCDHINNTMTRVLTTDEWTERIREQLGGSNCFDVRTHDEITEIMQDAGNVIADILG